MTTTRSPDLPPLGRLLTRREALALIGVPGAALLVRAVPALAQAGGALPSCVARPQQTEGPFFVDEALNRSDIRSDPKSGALRPGVPLRLGFRVSRLSGTTCTPLAGAQVDIWHSDAEGRYVEVNQAGCRMLGYTRTEILAKRVGDLVVPAERGKVEPALAMLKSGPSWSVLAVNRTRSRSRAPPVPATIVASVKSSDANDPSHAPSMNPPGCVSTPVPWNTATASLGGFTRAHHARGGSEDMR